MKSDIQIHKEDIAIERIQDAWATEIETCGYTLHVSNRDIGIYAPGPFHSFLIASYDIHEQKYTYIDIAREFAIHDNVAQWLARNPQ